MRGAYGRLLKLVLTVTVLSGFMYAGIHAGQEAEWQGVIRKDGVDVWSRKERGSGIEETMGSTVIAAGVDSLELIIDDIPSSLKWLPDCREAKVVRIIHENSREILFVTDAPWPLADRESLLVTEKQRDDATGGLVIEFHSVEDPAVPVGKGNVRMEAVEGRWALTPDGRGRTRVIYSVKGSPGGSLPSYLSNSAGRDLVFKTLAGLRAFVLQ